MPQALVDTTVLYAAGNARAARHDTAYDIIRGADRGDLPTLRIPDPILVETLNGLTRGVGRAGAVDVLARLQRATQFEITREIGAVWSAGVDLFEAIGRFSLGDAIPVASARHHDVRYLYSFDGDFDGLEDLRRLSIAATPFEP